MPQSATKTYILGAKSYPLTGITQDEQIRALFGQNGADEISAPDAYAAVPWLYRAIDVRSKAVQGMPFRLLQGKRDVTEAERYRALLKGFKRNLGLTEAALCLYGRSYLIRESNPSGANQQLRWLLPTTIEPKYSAAEGVVGFTRTLGQSKIPLALDQLVYCWTPSLTSEVGSGLAPAEVALRAAGVLHHLQEYLSAYFERGAIRATLLQIDGNPPQSEMAKLEAWWKKMLGGVRKAYETVALRASVKPVVIGDGLKDTVSPELTAQMRQDVATALGIPQTLLESDSANYATAEVEKMAFYEQTILPELELIEESLNDQFFVPLGLRLEFQANRLEVFQQREFQKSAALVPLADKGILTIDEVREAFGYGPKPQPETPPPPAPEQPEQPQPTTEEVAKSLDLDRWMRKILKALKSGKSPAVTFESDYLTPDEHTRIAELLSTATTPDEIRAILKPDGI